METPFSLINTFKLEYRDTIIMLFIGSIVLFVSLAIVFKSKTNVVPTTYPLIETGSLYEGANKIDDWYAVADLAPGTFAVTEYKSVEYNSIFLIIGTEKALLVDVGSGTRPKNNTTTNIEIAKRYTDLPFTYILTHFHVDHIGDLGEVDEVLMIDLPHLRKRVANNVLKLKLTETLKTGKTLIKIKDWVADGDFIDLGNRKIKVRHLPGHTPESIALFDKDGKQAFLGDILYTHPAGVVTFVPNGNVNDLAKTAKELGAEIDESYSLFGSHGQPKMSWEWFQKFQILMQKIEVNKIPYRWTFFWPIPIPVRIFNHEDMKLSSSLVKGLSLAHYPLLILVVAAWLVLAYFISFS